MPVALSKKLLKETTFVKFYFTHSLEKNLEKRIVKTE